MKRKTLQHIGIGFLASALISGGFWAVTTENALETSVNIQSLFNNNEEKLQEKDAEISNLSQKTEELNEKVEDLNKEISNLKEEKDNAEKKTKQLDKENASLKLELYGDENATTTDEENTEDTGNRPNNTQDTNEAVTGTFSIKEGSSSGDIAQDLEDAGYIDSAEEMKKLIDQWKLNEFIQANDYELSSDMTTDEILSTITNGAYYY